MQQAGRIRPAAAAALAALALALIVYGSLYPFRFRPVADWAGAVETLLAGWRTITTRGDVISNLVLYAPLGFFAATAMSRLRAAVAIPLVALAGALVSIAVELTQFQTYHRSTAMSDVYMNAAGALAGALVARLAPLALPRAGSAREPARGFAALTLAAWLGWRLYPYLPTFDLWKAKGALRPLLLAPAIPTRDWFRHVAGWLAVAMLLEAVAGPERRRIAFAVFTFVALAARSTLSGVQLSPAEVAGAALAVFVWTVGLAAMDARARIVAALLAAAIVLQGLEPFYFLPEPRPFGWVPFRSLIVGSTENNIRSFLEKTFLYGALLWLLVRSGLRLAWAALAVAAFVAALKWGQTWLPRRSGEITDVLLVLILAVVLRLSPGGRRSAT